MNKKILFIAFLAIFSLNAKAQYVFDEGDIAVNAGVGLISVDGLIPSFNLSAELGLIPTGDIGVISAGGAFEYKYSKLMGLYYNQITIGPRAAWHLQMEFLENTNFDLYAGLGAGLRVYSTYNFNNNSLDPKLGPYMEAFVGGRMMLDDSFGVFAELGGGAIASVKG
ncbi:MAG: hypothetical protein JW729_10905, partial [Bacteroidales bacterium]|nr:hypothetical protein [Bacteroidales bacterium]